MDCFVVFGCLALICSWIPFFYHSFWQHACIFMHFNNNSRLFYRQLMRSTFNRAILIKMPNKFYNDQFVFIIWSKSKWYIFLFYDCLSAQFFLSNSVIKCVLFNIFQVIFRSKPSLLRCSFCSITQWNYIHSGESFPNGYG